MAGLRSEDVDVLEAGQGDLVVLVHSSVSGARQWRKLMDVLSGWCHVKAVNLIGYGDTPPWTAGRAQRLDDQADVVSAVIPPSVEKVSLVGHSLGGTAAMKAAVSLGRRVGKLLLWEPNTFPLLREHGCSEAYNEVLALREVVKSNGARGDWMTAAECFADYWGGEGTWAQTPSQRRVIFAEALKQNFFEWDAILGDTTSLSAWSQGLPSNTLVAYDPQTVRPIREIVQLMKEKTPWEFVTVSGGGHMAPLTRPDLVNPIIETYLSS